MWDFLAWSGIVAYSLIAIGLICIVGLYIMAKAMGMPD